jgi:hypothetical protein
VRRFTGFVVLGSCVALIAAFSQVADATSLVSTPNRQAQAATATLVDRQRQIDLQRGQDGRVRASNPRLAALGALSAQQAVQRASLSPVASWSPLGPAPIPNGGTDTGTGAVSGRVTAVAVHPTNPNIVYVGTAQGGVWRTLDGGAHWVPIFDSAKSLSIGSVAIAPSSPSTVYVGTGEPSQSLDSYAGVGLYRIDNADTSPVLVGPIDPVVSFDVGGTPTSIHAFSGMSIGVIKVHPTNPAIVFVGTSFGFIGASGSFPRGGSIPPLPQAGLFRTTNGTAAASSVGFTHLTVRPEDHSNTFDVGSEISDLTLEPGNPNNLIAGAFDFSANAHTGIWRSTNALAATPTFTQRFATGDAEDRSVFAINKVGSTVTVVEAHGGLSVGKMERSVDGGATWSAVTVPNFCISQCWYDIAIAMDPASASTILLGGTANFGGPNVLKSTNAGGTWARQDVGLHSDTHAFAIAPSNHSIMFTGNDGGVWSSANEGTSWTNRNTSGFSATQFESLAVHPADENFTIGGTQDNGTNLRSSAGGWSQVRGGDGGSTVIDRNAVGTSNVTMYHTFSGPSVESSTNSGTSWSTAFGDATSDSSLFYPPLGRGPGTPNTVYLGTTKLRRSANGGATDTVVSQTFGSAISAIGIAPTNDNVRLIGLTSGAAELTTTGSSTLTNVTGPWPSLYVARTVIDPHTATTAYVTLDGFAGGTDPAHSQIWKTTNLSTSGTTWTSAGSGMPDVPVNAFAIDPANSNDLFAGTDIGVYRSLNGGASWTPFGTGLPIVAVFDLAVVAPGTPNAVLRAATHGRGMWQIPLGSPTTVSLTTPGTLTSAVTATFSAAVHQVNTSNFVLRVANTGANVAATMTCKNASAVVVNCNTGPVITAVLQPTSALIANRPYVASVDPEGPPPVFNAAKNLVPRTSLAFTAHT